MKPSEMKTSSEDIEMLRSMCNQLPELVLRKAVFGAVLGLSLISTGEAEKPPASSPVDVLVGLLGASGIGMVAQIVDRDSGEVVKTIGDVEEYAESLANAAISKAKQ